MSFFRAPFIVALFLGLITIGQGYALASVYVKASEAQCACNRDGHACRHGCELKKRISQSRGCHGKPVTAWVNPSCSKKAVSPAVSFHSDPFLPEKLVFAFSPHVLVHELRINFFHPTWLPTPESPPPKA